MPKEGKLKLNVDASVVAGLSCFSVGMVLRDHHGVFIRARNVKIAGEVSAFEAEAWGVRETLNWSIELSVKDVEVESDSTYSDSTAEENHAL